MGDFDVFVVTDDEIQTPHFHVWDRALKWDLHVCFAFEAATEVPHGVMTKGYLDATQLDALCAFSRHPRIISVTV